MSTLTVTAKVGPGFTVTAQAITNIQSFMVDTVTKLLTVIGTNGISQEYDITAATTFTVTIASGVYTITIS